MPTKGPAYKVQSFTAKRFRFDYVCMNFCLLQTL